MEKNNISLLALLRKNYLSWIVILMAVIIVSYPNISSGFITFLSLLFSGYFVHRFTHYYRNILTIVHHYHHENNNFFSHFSQILVELSFIVGAVPAYYILGDKYLNIWIALLFIIFYSTLHNYNYGYLRVNDVHFLHHQNTCTNIGPDICDVVFNTKHPTNIEVEDTNHYIPNIVIITFFVCILKYLSSNNKIKDILLNIYIVFSIFCVLFLFISSTYLYFYYDKKEDDDVKKEDDDVKKEDVNVKKEDVDVKKEETASSMK
jgi:hypothetical protein